MLPEDLNGCYAHSSIEHMTKQILNTSSVTSSLYSRLPITRLSHTFKRNERISILKIDSK